MQVALKTLFLAFSALKLTIIIFTWRQAIVFRYYTVVFVFFLQPEETEDIYWLKWVTWLITITEEKINGHIDKTDILIIIIIYICAKEHIEMQ